MASAEHVALVLEGAEQIANWRELNPDTRLDLTGADLTGADLYRANLSGAILHRANLYDADLYDADLTGAKLYAVQGLTCEQLSLSLNFEKAQRDEALACGRPIPVPSDDP